MRIPDYQSLMLPVLDVAAKGESSVPLASNEIAGRLGLTEEEREQMLPQREAAHPPQSAPLGEILPDEGWVARKPETRPLRDQ